MQAFSVILGDQIDLSEALKYPIISEYRKS